tara:strand:+ start:186 stop:560 length:375 start_codon:yes stop_codon:yes gene_type:complete
MTIAGYITDKNGDPLVGANAYVSDASGVPLNVGGSGTNINGQFDFQADSPEYISASFIGYETQTLRVTNKSSTELQSLNFRLIDKSYDLDEYEVVAKKEKKILPYVLGGVGLLGLCFVVIKILK